MFRFSNPKKRIINGRKSKHYYTTIYDNDDQTTRYRSTGQVKKEDADKWVDDRRKEQLEEESLEPISITDAINKWVGSMRNSGYSKSYLKNIKWRVSCFILNCKKKDLSRLTSADLSRYRDDRLTGQIIQAGKLPPRPVSAATVNSDLRTLRVFFNWCLNQEPPLLSRSPLRGVKPARGAARQRSRCLSIEQQARLLDCCKDKYTYTVKRGGERKGSFQQTKKPPGYLLPIVLTYMRSGLRLSTIMLLKPEHIDFKNGRWKVPNELMKSRRDFNVRMDNSVLQGFKDFLGKGYDPKKTIFGDSGSVRRSFKSAVARAGLEGVTPHDLRRVYLNTLRESGVPLDEAMALTDHRSIKTVMEYYREVSFSVTDDAIEKVESYRKAAAKKRKAK